MTNEQLYLAIGVPIIVNAIFNSILISQVNKRIDDLRQEMKDLINARFDTARAELLRVEQVMDARMKHIEERMR